MFDTLISNKNMKEQLSLAIKDDRPLNAYAFCGPEGIGKKTAAVQFAAELVVNGKDKALRGAHPDVIFVRPESGKRTIGVEIIRNMRQDAFVTPTEGKRKVYIIDGALGDAGQNALLTVLEQPPSFTVFIILAANRRDLLPTVLSRCSVYDMEYVDNDDGVSVLKKHLPNMTEDQLMTYMRASGGNIGYALTLAKDGGYIKNVGTCTDICIAMAKDDGYTLAKMLTNFKKKESLISILQVLTVYLRDVLIYNCTKNTDNLVFYDEILKNSEVFAKIEIERLYNCVNECASAITQLESGISLMLVSCSLVTHLCGGETLD